MDLSRDKLALLEVEEWVTRAVTILQGKVKLFHPGHLSPLLSQHTKEVGRGGIGNKVLFEDMSTGDLELGFRMLETVGRHTIKILEFRKPADRNWIPFVGSLYFVRDEEYTLLIKFLEEVEQKKAPAFPILADDISKEFRQNTLGFLLHDEAKYVEYALPYRRGVLLAGLPGNGKTLACRWLVHECRTQGLLARVVTPDEYLAARDQHWVDDLFRLPKKGVIIFDDLDIALKQREEDASGGWDQANFLTALDGVSRQDGVVYIFTTNLSLSRIDEAIRRPGRIDVVLAFPLPTAVLRKKFIESWPTKIIDNLPNVLTAVSDTKDLSFAAMEELRCLFAREFLESGTWDWLKVVRWFRKNRDLFSREFKRDASS